MKSRPPRFHLLLAAAALACFAGQAHATDVASATPPLRLADGTLQIGARTLRLPPGDWTLVQVKDFHGTPRLRDLEMITAWAVDIDHQQLRMALQLSLPLAEMKKMHRIVDNPCTARDGVLRGDYSRSKSEMECLAVFGHHDLNAIIAGRGTKTAHWLARKGIAPVGDGVEFTYSHREGLALGRVAMYFPARYFASDDEAARWAQQVRDNFEPLIEGRSAEARLPALPAAVQSAERAASQP